MERGDRVDVLTYSARIVRSDQGGGAKQATGALSLRVIAGPQRPTRAE